MKLQEKNDQPIRRNESTKKVYEAPAIIYEGVIGTRAGTPTFGGLAPNNDPAISPEDLFGK